MRASAIKVWTLPITRSLRQDLGVALVSQTAGTSASVTTGRGFRPIAVGSRAFLLQLRSLLASSTHSSGCVHAGRNCHTKDCCGDGDNESSFHNCVPLRGCRRLACAALAIVPENQTSHCGFQNRPRGRNRPISSPGKAVRSKLGPTRSAFDFRSLQMSRLKLLNSLADGVGFEPTEGLHLRRFSSSGAFVVLRVAGFF